MNIRFNKLGSWPLVAAVALAACSGAGDETPDGGSGTGTGADSCFIAYDADFAPFTSWTSYAYTAPNDIGGNIHFAGPRTEYINKAPPNGATSFPVGTIIVKEIDGISVDTHHIFAMVKRGCSYNSGGADGWEWFELSQSGSTYSIIWGGTNAPPGESYDAGNATCNSCHLSCADNDYVCSPDLQLGAD